MNKPAHSVEEYLGMKGELARFVEGCLGCGTCFASFYERAFWMEKALPQSEKVDSGSARHLLDLKKVISLTKWNLLH